MVDHMLLPVDDFEASKEFYVKTFATLGAKVAIEGPGFVMFGNANGLVMGLGKPKEADGGVVRNHLHVGFRADSVEAVKAWHAAAIAAGGKDNGAPGPRPHGAFVFDPSGHNVEACFHGYKPE